MSSRMKRPKQLLEVGGKRLLQLVLEEALKVPWKRLVVVLGYRHEGIREALAPVLSGPGLEVVVNSRFQEGLSSSLVAGLNAVSYDCDHALFLLGDMPLVRASVIEQVRKVYLDSGLPVGALRLRDRPAHPVVFHRSLYPELLDLEGDQGARAILQRNAGRISLASPPGGYEETDIDTEEDYERLCLHLKAKTWARSDS